MGVMRAIMVIMATAVVVVRGDRREQAESKLRQQLVRELGMEGVGDGREANISALELTRMRGVWLEAERQAEVVREVKRGWRRGRGMVKRDEELVARVEERVGALGQTKVKLVFPVEELVGEVMVVEAKLMVRVEEKGRSGGRGRLVQLVEGEEGVTLASNLEKDLEIGDVVQEWLEEPNTNLGLLLLLPPGVHMVGLPTLLLSLEEGRRSRRSRRSTPDSSDCSNRKDNRCCRKDMVVDLTKLKGYNFIYEPQQFNAFMCGGRCPARFLPLNDHSLLQSLLHLQGQEDPEEPRVKRPCCVPAKYESMNILHLDPDNSSKLKVTSWKSIIVTACACG